MQRLVFAFTFLAIGTFVNAQDFRTAKSKHNYPPAPLEKIYEKYNEGQYNNALALVNEYLETADSLKDMRTFIAALELKFHVYRRQKDVGFLGALPVIEEAVALAKEHLETSDILMSRVYKTFGTVYHREEDFYTARSVFDTAINLYNKANQYDSTLYGTLLRFKYYGYAYSFGSEDTLMKYLGLREALERTQKITDPESFLYILQDYPELYINKGDYDKALTKALEAYKYAQENKGVLLQEGPDFIYSFETYADTYERLIDALYYKEYYEESLKIGESLFSLMNEYGISRVEYSEYYSIKKTLGQVYLNQGDYDNALLSFGEALKIGYGNQVNARFSARVLASIGDCLLRLGNKNEAKEYYNKGLNTLRNYLRMPSPSFHQPFDEIGDFYLSKRAFEKALTYYDSALSNSMPLNRNNWHEFPVDTTQDLSYSQLKTLGKKANALSRIDNDSISKITLLKSTLKYSMTLSNILIGRRKEFNAVEGKLFLSQEFKRVYETALDASFHLHDMTKDQEYIKKALHFSRLSKSILFLEQVSEYEKVNNNIISDELKVEFGQQIKSLEKLQSGFASLLDEGITSDSIVIVNDQIESLRNDQDSLTKLIDDELERAGIEPYAETYLQGLDEINVNEGEMLIEFFYGDEQIYVISFSQDGGEFFKLDLTDEFQEDLLYLLNELRNPPSLNQYAELKAEFTKKSFAVYKKLLKPTLDKNENIKNLVIIPDNLLSRLPFEVLITTENQASKEFSQMDFLVKEYNIRYELSSLRLKTGSAVQVKNKMLALGYSGSSSAGDALGALPGTEREIQALKKVYGGTFINSAEKKDFMNKARDFEIIHLAVHGLADTTTTNQSKLIFSGSGENELYTSDLYLASLNAKLAVLSACETGVGSIQKGEGAFSIARGFAIAGVPSLVMTLWSVNDQITANMMGNMYDSFIAKGENINDALRETKLHYLKEADDYLAHPYYWAAFVHLGQDVESGGKSKNSILFYSFIILFLLVVLFYAGYKKRKRTN